jgi:hypothetical protein
VAHPLLLRDLSVAIRQEPATFPFPSSLTQAAFSGCGDNDTHRRRSRACESGAFVGKFLQRRLILERDPISGERGGVDRSGLSLPAVAAPQTCSQGACAYQQQRGWFGDVLDGCPFG